MFWLISTAMILQVATAEIRINTAMWQPVYVSQVDLQASNQNEIQNIPESTCSILTSE